VGDVSSVYLALRRGQILFIPKLQKFAFNSMQVLTPDPEMSELNTTPDRPPLWRVMHDAFLSSTLSGEEGHQGFAAEIRALRDQIEQRQVDDYAVVLPDVQEVLNWLTAEAERAERGDG
jgi:hypothetical protein